LTCICISAIAIKLSQNETHERDSTGPEARTLINLASQDLPISNLPKAREGKSESFVLQCDAKLLWLPNLLFPKSIQANTDA
jgi:hypothetical protein